MVIKALEDTGEHIVEYIDRPTQLVKKYNEVCSQFNNIGTVCELKEYGKRILDELNWHGICMVEFKGTLKIV